MRSASCPTAGKRATRSRSDHRARHDPSHGRGSEGREHGCNEGLCRLFHLHRDSDEVVWVLAGEITFMISEETTVGGPGTCAFFPRNVPHAGKSTGSETWRVLFL